MSLILKKKFLDFLLKSPNKPTIPQDKIRRITTSFPNSPQSPFYDPTNKPMPPFAKLTIKKIMSRGKQCPNGVMEHQGVEMDAAEFDPKDMSDFMRRNRILDSEAGLVGKKSRGKNQKMILIGMKIKSPKFYLLTAVALFF